MPFQPPPRPLPVLASVLAAAGIALAVASCSRLTPIGPTPPAPRDLGSPIILQAIRNQPPTPAGGCPGGWAALSVPGTARTCYRKLGPPVTITSAGVSPVISGPRVSPPGPPGPAGQQSGPPSYGFAVAVPPGDVAAVTAVIRQAYDSRGALDISVAGKTWAAPQVFKPFPGQQFQIFLPSRSQILRLRRILVPPS